MLPSIVPVSTDNVNAEITAMIMKAEARKHGCDIQIDFHHGKRDIVFIGDETMKAYVASVFLGIMNISYM